MRPWSRAALVVGLLGLCFPAANGQDIKFEKYELTNGMKVILHEDHTLPVATVNIWYHVGSKDEPPHRSGFAHLFEHLMFMGTERVPTGDFDRIMEAGGGNNNASTTQDRTNFYDYGPASLLPTLLWLEADRLEDLGRMMDQHKLDLQRQVVENERRENYENAPYGMVPLEIDKAMYPENHPYHIDTIGLTEDIDQATVEDVKSFFSTYYLPNNATMVVAGDFDPTVIKPIIEKYFGTLPRGNDPIHRTAPEPKLQQARRLTMVDQVAQARTYMVWHGPAIFNPGDAEMDVLAGILSDGLASRLYQRVVVKDQLATDISAEQESQELGSLFTISATAREGASLDKIEADIDAEIANLIQKGPTADELSRVKARYSLATLSGLQDISQVADLMNEYDAYLGNPNSFKWDLERHTKVTASDVQNWAKKILDPDARLILRVVPASEVGDQNPRDERPESLPDKPIQLPHAEAFKLSNGIEVRYFARTDLPLMSVALNLDRGSISDPKGKAGLESLTLAMLHQGAGDLDASGFSKALAELGANVTENTEESSASINLASTAQNFDRSLALFSQMVRSPKLSREDFEREQSIRLEDLMGERDDPESMSRIVAMGTYFGLTSGYGRNIGGDPQSVKDLTPDDVAGEWRLLGRPSHATLFVAGSLPLDHVKSDLEKAFGDWRPGTAESAIDTPPASGPAPEGLRLVIVNRPGSVQTVIRFMFPGAPYESPNRIGLAALGSVLGGTFTSRLNEDLREEHGYSYGAYAHYQFEPGLGYFSAVSSVRADVTGASLKEFLAQFSRISKGDVTDAEAKTARNSMKTDIVTGISTLGGLLSLAEVLHENGADFEALQQDLAHISTLSATDLNSLAKQALPMEHCVLVLVGDRDSIVKQIADLNLPKPEIIGPP